MIKIQYKIKSKLSNMEFVAHKGVRTSARWHLALLRFNTCCSLSHVDCWIHGWLEHTDQCLGSLSVAITEYVKQTNNVWTYFNSLLRKSMSAASWDPHAALSHDRMWKGKWASRLRREDKQRQITFRQRHGQVHHYSGMENPVPWLDIRALFHDPNSCY